MAHNIIVFLHIFGACGALVSGFLALRWPNGTSRHRLVGKLYLAFWITLFVGGNIIGYWHRQLSPFQILNWIGVSWVAYGYGLIFFRKRLGRVWLRKHYGAMVTSMAFLVIATANQILPRVGVTYPMWVFYLMVASPFLVIPGYMRNLDRRFGFAKQEQPKTVVEEQVASV